VMFVTRDTKDEVYFWSSRNKEMQMRRELDSLRLKLRARRGLPDMPRRTDGLTRAQLEDMLTPQAPTEREQLAQKVADTKGQKSLGEYPKGSAKGAVPLAISAAVAGTGLAEALEEAGFSPRVEDLGEADIVISERVAVAFRTVDQFLAQLGDGSISRRMSDLRRGRDHPVLIVQGAAEGRGFQEGNSAAYDFIGSVMAEHGVTALSTVDSGQTAAAVASLHRQEDGRGKERTGRQTTFDQEGGRMFLVQGLPNVSATISERLLRRLGSPERVAGASVEDLSGAEGIGRVIAEGIHTAMRRRRGEG
ncbi:MAG: ERCC4 domain-containing protein, partial [Thermoplasmata archaeon]